MAAATVAQAVDLTVYTAVEAEDLKKYAKEFNKTNPDIKIKWVRDSTGIVTAKLLAEKNNPKADVVWGLAATSLDRIVASSAAVAGDLLRVRGATVEGLAAKRVQILTDFQQLILRARQMVSAPGAQPGAVFRQILNEVGYRQRLEQEITNPRLLARQS